jgi:hypothetical protein
LQSQAADYEVAPSLVCNTPEQVERFVALFAGDAQAAIRVVNRGNRLGTGTMPFRLFQLAAYYAFGVKECDLILSLAISVGTTSVKIVGTPRPPRPPEHVGGSGEARDKLHGVRHAIMPHLERAERRRQPSSSPWNGSRWAPAGLALLRPRGSRDGRIRLRRTGLYSAPASRATLEIG